MLLETPCLQNVAGKILPSAHTAKNLDSSSLLDVDGRVVHIGNYLSNSKGWIVRSRWQQDLKPRNALAGNTLEEHQLSGLFGHDTTSNIYVYHTTEYILIEAFTLLLLQYTNYQHYSHT